ncbi:MAG: type VI secretion system ATPase TssH, partial [Candidatus Pacebacteria bacterium]|nr:type VI secretion system ATPase TssH [Candidatus Paceibacterota bacterium]
MNIEKFTQKSQESISQAHQLAAAGNHNELTGLHLFAALLDQEDGLAANVIGRAGADPESLRQAIESRLGKLPRVEGPGASQVYTSREISKVLQAAQAEAAKMKDEYVSVDHLLLALVDESKQC